MNWSRLLVSGLPLVLGIGLLLSGCIAEPFGYGGYDEVGYYDGWGGWHHGWDHSHWDHGGGEHGFARGGFGGHGGGHR
jgi:hypothetical protein